MSGTDLDAAMVGPGSSRLPADVEATGEVAGKLHRRHPRRQPHGTL